MFVISTAFYAILEIVVFFLCFFFFYTFYCLICIHSFFSFFVALENAYDPFDFSDFLFVSCHIDRAQIDCEWYTSCKKCGQITNQWMKWQKWFLLHSRKLPISSDQYFTHYYCRSLQMKVERNPNVNVQSDFCAFFACIWGFVSDFSLQLFSLFLFLPAPPILSFCLYLSFPISK